MLSSRKLTVKLTPVSVDIHVLRREKQRIGKSLLYLLQVLGPVWGSPALRAPAYFSIAAPRSDPISHERSALQPYPALHAPPYININAPRSDKALALHAPVDFPLTAAKRSMSS